MRNETRALFNGYINRQGELNGGVDARQSFTVEPTIEQKLEDRIAENAEFLGQINIVPVDQIKGEKLGLGSGSTIARRTDTSAADRQTSDPHSLTADQYECFKTDFDTHIRYQLLDMWAKFPDFQERLRNQVTLQIARDRLTIGWNGTSAAANTDPVTNPLLQDVNIGWLQQLRANAPERVLSAIRVGDQAGADYKNMDGAVTDAVNELIAPWHQEAPDLVVIAGRRIIADKYLALVESSDAPTERVALRTLMSNKQLGALPTERVPFFPGSSFLITSKSNLSIYWQTGSRRRTIRDKPERDRVEDFQSVNEAYVVEDYEKCAFVEGILQPDGAGGWE
jgi:P2 family phage major capsid protein